jgi:hypothetical protein
LHLQAATGCASRGSAAAGLAAPRLKYLSLQILAARRGPLNERSVIPQRLIFNEPDGYGAALPSPAPAARFASVADLASRVNEPSVTSVVLDMFGAMGYLPQLISLCPGLGQKVAASGVPVAVMAGVLAEAAPGTLPLPGRDPRAAMNGIYSPAGTAALLALAAEHALPLLFATNDACSRLLCFGDAGALCAGLGLRPGSLLARLAAAWYGPHLRGRCIPFDWVALVAMLLAGRSPGLLETEERELWVGAGDASILVLRDPASPGGAIEDANLAGTRLWGRVASVVRVDDAALRALAATVAEMLA